MVRVSQVEVRLKEKKERRSTFPDVARSGYGDGKCPVNECKSLLK